VPAAFVARMVGEQIEVPLYGHVEERCNACRSSCSALLVATNFIVSSENHAQRPEQNLK
jgi:hypothetical protein